MIGIPVNPNSVYVPIVQTGCLKAEFDSTYPIHLNGIISQEEFRESIHRINRTIASNKILLILGIIFALGVVGGMICFIVGGVRATRGDGAVRGFPALVGVGLALVLFGSILFMIGCCTIQFRRLERMRQAIATESMKYSSRSPTPCSWRLDSTRHCTGGYGNRNNSQLVYHLVIDIGRSAAPGSNMYYSNQAGPTSTLGFGQQDNYAPPPYPNQSAGYCAQCGAPRQDLTARFCPSCGHSVNKY